MNTLKEKPTKDDQQIARQSLFLLERLDDETITKNAFIDITTGKEGPVHIKIPATAFKFLKVILRNMAEGKAIAIAEEEAELSTQQAANLLGMSRPYLVDLLESGKIPFSKVGTHRRIRWKDLKKYEAKQQKNREEGLAQLAQEAQALGLGY
jgi:excisionase family DNA binding protein